MSADSIARTWTLEFVHQHFSGREFGLRELHRAICKAGGQVPVGQTHLPARELPLRVLRNRVESLIRAGKIEPVFRERLIEKYVIKQRRTARAA